MSEKEFDVICMGMALVDSIIRGFDPRPVSASGYRADSGSLNVGGEAVNAAIAAARLGLKTGIVCALGGDEAGDMIAGALRRNGVDTRLTVSSPMTPVTTMFVHADGSRKSITNQAHRFQFHPERDPSRFIRARALILGSLFRAPFDDPEIVFRVLTAARAAGQIVFADTKLPGSGSLTLADLRESLPLIDTITPNEDEARYFTGREDPREMADVFLETGVRQVIIKLGPRGCYLKNAKEEHSLPACRIDPVDATGAGDNLMAGFVSEILRGASAEEALRFGNACGAICATAVGATAALRSREQVLGFLRENEESYPSDGNLPCPDEP